MLKKDEVKDIFLLKEKDKLTFKEIANKLGVTEPTAEYRYKVAKLKYAPLIGDKEKDKESVKNSNSNLKESAKSSVQPTKELNPNILFMEDYIDPGAINSKKQKEDKGTTNKVKGNIYLILILGIGIAVIAILVAKQIKEGGGGSKVEEPQPQSPSPAPAVPEGREWVHA